MGARSWIVFGCGCLALLSPVVAEEIVRSYGLEELRALARSAHPSLEAADAAVESAMSALGQARAFPNPELTLDLGRGRPRAGGDARSERSVELAQPIELPGLRRWRARSAELGLRGAELDRALAETVIDSTVSRLAYTVLLERRRTESARDSTGVAARLVDLLARRVELGESAPLEALRARAEWFARRGDLVDAEGALAAARAALDRLCGDLLPEDYEIAETLEGPGALALPADLGERVHARNPFLLRARLASDEARARANVARRMVFPGVDVRAGHETELDRSASTLGLGLTLPLWDRKRGAAAAADAETLRATADARALALELETSLDRASGDYRRALAAIRLHEEGWSAAAGQALEIATFSFENGEASLLEVLDAQRSHLEVSLAEAEAWAALALARAEIERLIAGPLGAGGSR